MKNRLNFLVLLFTLTSLSRSSHAQGNLTPPGAPAATMKTLAQVEPRIPVQTISSNDATAQYIITQPGSYYLTGNITGVVAKAVIAINADGVHLDLGGHILTGVAGATRGIEIRGTHNQLVIENGTIRGFDTAGISAASAQKDVRIERVSVGAISAGSGITLSSSSTAVLVRGCTVSDITGGGGILLGSSRGTVEQCAVTDCTGSATVTGIQAQNVSDCEVSVLVGTVSASALGIFAQEIKGCAVNSVSCAGTGAAIGISATTIFGCNVLTVTAVSGSATGISGTTVGSCTVSTVNASADGDCTGITSSGPVSNCRTAAIGNASSSGGGATGISALMAQGCTVAFVGGTGTSNSPTGIDADTVANCTVTSVEAAVPRLEPQAFPAARSPVPRCQLFAEDLPEVLPALMPMR